MATDGTIYTIKQTRTRDKLDVAASGTVSLPRAYSSLCTMTVDGKQLLLGYTKRSKKADTYEVLPRSPWLTPVPNELETLVAGRAWDALDPFVIGDLPYLMAYEATKGEFAFFPITDDLEAKHPLYLIHDRPPVTTNCSTVKMLESAGQVFLFTYDKVHGYINLWPLSVTATSDGTQPPLSIIPSYIHQWAQGWVRFAFFQFGGVNFFLKTNVWKLNVNIDTIHTGLDGTNEVGTHLEAGLEDPLKIDIVHPFVVGDGDPYFLTYRADTGASTFNRFHGDCLGWTEVAELTAIMGAGQIVPYRIGAANYALYVAKPATKKGKSTRIGGR